MRDMNFILVDNGEGGNLEQKSRMFLLQLDGASLAKIAFSSYPRFKRASIRKVLADNIKIPYKIFECDQEALNINNGRKLPFRYGGEDISNNVAFVNVIMDNAYPLTDLSFDISFKLVKSTSHIMKLYVSYSLPKYSNTDNTVFKLEIIFDTREIISESKSNIKKMN